LKDNLTCLSHRFGYQNLLHNVATVCIVTPEIPAIIVDATVGILAATAIPALISYTNEIKITEIYSNNLLEISQKNASLTWDDSLFSSRFQDSFKSLLKLMDICLQEDSLLLAR